ncbi:TIGR00730 family Rossman fold protein [Candidatus Nomurabacteria bacterium]|nr:TIGR00730 family Rossman fold protein [Candidatus Nomurabacteria bacterium]
MSDPKKHHKPYKHINVEPMTFVNLNKDTQERVDRIAEEFKNGFTMIGTAEKSVTFWGSARTMPHEKDYKKAYSLAQRIVKELGYSIVTGGGPGIMAAANCGSYDAGGKSVGLTIKLPMEQKTNLCVTHHMDFKYFFARKVCLAFAAEAYVYFPGGFGTMDELFEILTLVQTNKMEKVPIILVGKKYWKGLEKFIHKKLLRGEKIDKGDDQIYTITDNEDEIIEIIRNAPLRSKDSV